MNKTFRPSLQISRLNCNKFVFLQIISGICSRTPIDCGHQASKGREVEFYLDVVEELLARGEAGKKTVWWLKGRRKEWKKTRTAFIYGEPV